MGNERGAELCYNFDNGQRNSFMIKVVVLVYVPTFGFARRWRSRSIQAHSFKVDASYSIHIHLLLSICKLLDFPWYVSIFFSMVLAMAGRAFSLSVFRGETPIINGIFLFIDKKK